MFLNQWNNRDWQRALDWLSKASNVDKNVVTVLSVISSLTAFVEQRFGMLLTVQLHDQFMDKITADEATLLGCDEGIKVLRRQVSLLHQGDVMFDAESILPLQGISHELLHELEAGVRPLANLLAEYGMSLSRSDLSMMQLQDGRWARRSVLRSARGTQALVVEVFQPLFWQRLQAQQVLH